MAGLALSAGIASILGLGTPAILGQDAGKTDRDKIQPPPITAAEDKTPKDDSKNAQTVKLVLRIAGLGAEGCDVEIKPATPACRFRPVKRHVGASGELDDIVIRDLQARGADRNFSFAITVNEPGQKPRTILRGFRLAPRTTGEASPSQPQQFVCWLSSPSKLARIEGTTTRK